MPLGVMVEGVGFVDHDLPVEETERGGVGIEDEVVTGDGMDDRPRAPGHR
ncbi:hypothetical protein HLB23_24265 [Nocardia uniformis]|uniref:Uncharacterized protein n=1 Tax=Nocardia uniformis TaxID=53432 RepID=A0A849C5I3_9NOCA|nr:hypothetical protein [Nocardia uniformis]NNH72936.1 hypothetical protein [Nocardia uniformis]